MTAAVDDDERRFRLTAEWLRKVRDQLGMTQAELAVSLGVSRPTIANAEVGRYGLTSDVMLSALALAGFLDELS